MLTPVGYRISAAGSTDEALNWLRQNRVDLLLVDVESLSSKAYDLCELVRNDPVFDSPAIVMVVSHTNYGMMFGAMEAGVDDIIISPIREKELRVRTWRLVAGKGMSKVSGGRSSKGIEGTDDHDLAAVLEAEASERFVSEFDNLITSISTDFINYSREEIDPGVHKALEILCEFIGMDQARIFTTEEQDDAFSLTHIWSKPGTEVAIETQTRITAQDLPWIMAKLNRFDSIRISRLADLPEEAQRERDWLESLNIQTQLLIPMTFGGVLHGFLALESIGRSVILASEIISKLRIVGEIFVGALERKQTAESLLRRDTILQAVSFAAERFLRGEDWERNVQEIISHFGEVMRVSRVFIFQSHFGMDGRRLISPKFEWTGPDIDPQIDNPNLHGVPLESSGLDRWEELLLKRETLHGLVEEFPDGEREWLLALDVRSTIILSIFVGDELWGFISFDDNITGRVWSPAEIEALGVATDIFGEAIKHGRSQEALKESEAKYSSLVEHAREGVVIIQAGECIFANKGMSDLTGYPPEEIVGQSFINFVPIQLRGLFDHRHKLRLAGEDVPIRYESKILCKDETVLDVEISAGLIQYRGSPSDMQMIRDITLRKQAEAAMKQAREQEIEIGSRIQETLLTGVPPVDLKGATIGAVTLPSQKIDGDFIDFYRHSDTSFDVIVGDVMGKGYLAALVGAATKAQILQALNSLIIGGFSGKVPEPESIVAQLHREVTSQLIELESFVTLCYARFNLETATVTIVDCGHTRAIHYRQSNSECELIQGLNVPLGFIEEEDYKQVTASFSPGDIFVFYSDGVTEAKDIDGQMFGEDGLKQAVQEENTGEPDEMIAALRRRVEDFAGKNVFGDDFTCVVVQIRPVDETQVFKSLDIVSRRSDLAKARILIRNTCETAKSKGIEPHRAAELALAVHEALCNVMFHSYEDREDGPINIKTQITDEGIVVDIHHNGKKFDPEKVAPPVFDDSAEGGFGVYIISNHADEVDYNVDDSGENHIRIYKRYKGEEN